MKLRVRHALIAGAMALPAAIAYALLGAASPPGRALPGANVRTTGGEAIAAERLGNSDYCGHCHEQIFHEWNASAHHFSSLNNPIYREAFISTAEQHGESALRVCAGCHDPLPLVAGEALSATITSWSSTAGITCLACHRITEVHGGNGAYTISAPTLHPFALSDRPWQQELHRWLLAALPQLHRSVLSKPLYASAEYCASCHTVTATKETNGKQDLLLQNEYASWHSSRFSSGKESGSETKMTCIDCHMPEVPSKDPAARNGLIRSHRFVGGNTLLAHMNRDGEQLEAAHAFLRNGAVQLRCKSAGNPAGASAACSEHPVQTGQRVLLTLELANAAVGHDFPGGTNDSNQAWLEVTAVDASGRTLLHSGALSADGDPDDSAYTLRTIYADKHGRVLDRLSSSTDASQRVFSNVLAPGERRDVTYEIHVDEQARLPITVDARLNWRKFSASFLGDVLGPDAPTIPLTVIAETRVQLDTR